MMNNLQEHKHQTMDDVQPPLPDIITQVKQEPYQKDYDQLEYNHLPKNPTTRRARRQAAKKKKGKEVVQGNSGITTPAYLKTSDLPRQEVGEKMHRNSSKVQSRSRKKTKDKEEPTLASIGKEKVKSYINRRRIDWPLATELLKAAQSKNMDLFYQKAEEMEKRCKISALTLHKVEGVKQKKRYQFMKSNEEGKSDPLPEPKTFDEIHQLPIPVNELDSKLIVNSKNTALDHCPSILLERNWYDLWQEPVFSQDLYEFKSQCLVPHMCPYCPINDHDYCKRDDTLYHEVTPCIHFFSCKHMNPPCREPSPFGIDTEEVTMKGAVGVVNNEIVQCVEHVTDDVEVDILGFEEDADVKKPEPDLYCWESLPVSPKKTPEAVPGTEQLSAQIQSRRRKKRVAWGISESATITGRSVADSQSLFEKNMTSSAQVIHCATHASEIVVPKCDIWYSPPLHLDMFTDLDKVDPSLRKELEKTDLPMIFYDSEGRVTRVDYTELFASVSADVRDIIIKIRLKWLDTVRLLVQKLVHNKQRASEYCTKQNIIYVINQAVIDRRTFYKITKEYLGVPTKEAFIIGDFIAVNAQNLFLKALHSNKPEQMETVLPILPFLNVPVQNSTLQLHNCTIPSNIVVKRRKPIMTKDRSYIGGWPNNVEFFREMAAEPKLHLKVVNGATDTETNYRPEQQLSTDTAAIQRQEEPTASMQALTEPGKTQPLKSILKTSNMKTSLPLVRMLPKIQEPILGTSEQAKCLCTVEQWTSCSSSNIVHHVLTYSNVKRMGNTISKVSIMPSVTHQNTSSLLLPENHQSPVLSAPVDSMKSLLKPLSTKVVSSSKSCPKAQLFVIPGPLNDCTFIVNGIVQNVRKCINQSSLLELSSQAPVLLATSAAVLKKGGLGSAPGSLARVNDNSANASRQPGVSILRNVISEPKPSWTSMAAAASAGNCPIRGPEEANIQTKYSKGRVTIFI